jgi:nicotinamidase/pyrazinamidase
VLDALQLGFATTLIEDGCRAVNLQPDDGAKAIADMVRAGAKLARSNEVR